MTIASPRPVPTRPCREERLEDPLAHVAWNARPAIVHRHPAHIALGANPDLHRFTAGGLAGIHRHVQQRRTQHVGVGEHAHPFTAGDIHRRPGVAGCDPGADGDFARERPHVYRVQPCRLRPGVEQQVFNFLVQFVDALDHRANNFAVVRSCRAMRDTWSDARRPASVPDFVGHDRGELSEVRERGLFPDLRFRVLACRDVTADRGYCRGFPRPSRNGTIVVSTQ